MDDVREADRRAAPDAPVRPVRGYLLGAAVVVSHLLGCQPDHAAVDADRVDRPEAMAARAVGTVQANAVPRQTVEIAWTEPLPDALTGFSLVEPWLAIDPTDPSHLVGAGMAVGTPGGLQTAVVSSRDGGRSWRVGRDRESDDVLFPDGDPMVVLSPDGTPFLTTLHDGFTVWKTTDGDTLWSRTGRVPGGSYDRQWLAFDRSGGEHHGRLYAAGKIWIHVVGSPARDVAAFSWSDDGGESFRDPELVLPDPTRGSLNIVAQIQALGDGSLVAPYHMILWPSVSPPPPGSPPGLLDGEIAVLRSDDGRSWEEPVRVGRMRKWGHGDQTRMFKGMGAGGLAVGPGPDGGERLHLVWSDIVDGWLQVMAAHSTDGGRSWSEPVLVNQGGFESNHGNPGVAVDGLGRVAVVWNDRRDDPGERCIRPYLALSHDGGRSFTTELPLSRTPVCPPGGRWMNLGDTQGIVGLPGGGFHVLWVGGAARPDQPFRLFSSRVIVR